MIDGLELAAREIPATHGDLRLHARSTDDRDDIYISFAGILMDTRSPGSQLVSVAVELMVSGVPFRDTTWFATLRANGLRRAHQGQSGLRNENEELSLRWRKQAGQ